MQNFQTLVSCVQRGKLAMAACVAGLVVLSSATLSPTAAFASGNGEDADPDELTAQQIEVIEAWNEHAEPISGVARVAPLELVAGDGSSTNAMEAPQRSYSLEVSLYRGSWLAWASERVYWRYDGRRMLSSSGYQSTGAIFPNNVTALGTSRIRASSTMHSWRGSYRVGAGVPTPWGNANVYNWTSTARIDVLRNGACNGWWVN